MPDEPIVLDAPDLAAPPTTPELKGTAALMDDLVERPVAPEPKPDTTPDPTKPAAVKPPEPTKKPDVKPVVPATPKPDAAKEPKDLPQLRKAYDELKKQKADLEVLHGNTKKELESKLSTLEKKRFWTPEDEQKAAAINKELQEKSAKLYARDFKESPDFKKNFEEKYLASEKEALGRVKSLTVKFVKDNEEQERQATAKDFQRVMDAPLEEQYAKAKELFGDNAHIVLTEANRLMEIERSAHAAISEKQQNWQKEYDNWSNAKKQEDESYVGAVDEGEGELAKTHPQFFGESDDPKEMEAFNTGRTFVASFENKEAMAKLSPTERGFKIALFRSWASAFPRMHYRTTLLTQQLEEANAKLAAFEKTDPGNLGGDTPSGDGQGDKEVVDTNKMAADLDLD